MKEPNAFKFTNAVLYVPIISVFIMWLVYWIEIKFNYNFNHFGIYPRTIKGIRGVFLSPFIHGDAKHLFNNSLPILVLIAALILFYKKIAYRVLCYGSILTGILTWMIARESYHIGASGVVYLLVSFIFFSGILRKHYRLVALSLIIVFLYGSTMWYLFPIENKISWEGHLSGFIIGFLFSMYYRNIGPQKIKHRFNTTEFDTWFDDKGKFNPPPHLEEE